MKKKEHLIAILISLAMGIVISYAMTKGLDLDNAAQDSQAQSWHKFEE